MMEAIKGLATALGGKINLCKANNSAWLTYALGFLQQFGPFPGAQKAHCKAHVHQVEKVGGKFEHAQGIHDYKLDAITHAVCLCLCTCIIQHFAADISPEQLRHARIGFCRLDKPATSTTADIEHALEDGGIRLFRQDPSHSAGDHLVLKLQ